MIDADKRKAIFLLHNEGMAVKAISRQLRVSVGAVREIIRNKGVPKIITRSDRKRVPHELLTRLYGECNGFVQRVHERLKEENDITIGYSTLTRMVRDVGLGVVPEKRDALVPDQPGAEMQHDTSPYNLLIGGKKKKVIGSSLYLRYSKLRYVKFYPNFNRFSMKCFFHEALTHFGYTAGACIIDNTNLAVHLGSGAKAVMAPEMVRFAEQYGFIWQAHEINHSDRKGGVESGFWYVETNFFPGRVFKNLEDLNHQAFEWATKRIPLRPHKKTKLIPAETFEMEKAYLKSLPAYVSPPVKEHDRTTDQYGYAPFDGNFYWVPGVGRPVVKVLQFSEKIRIVQNRKDLIEYDLPAWGIENKRFKPKHIPDVRPKNRNISIVAEEQRLKALGADVDAFVTAIKKRPLSNRKRNQLIRQVFQLSQKLSPEVFLKVIVRALHYEVYDIETLERMAVYLLRQGPFDQMWDESSSNAIEVCPELHTSELPDIAKYDEHFIQDGEDDEQGT